MTTLLQLLAASVSLALFAVDAPPNEVKSFAPGIRIDWSNLTVELQSEVVLRDGAIELFACSPRSKEHESILVVYAKPSQVFQAMGLVGLSPGSPVRYVEQDDRWEPAKGDALDLRVRCGEGDDAKFFKPEDWVLRSKGETTLPPPALFWVFAGSLTSKDGRFAADLEGTLASLVDFESSLIALSTSHSADNEQLWLVPNTERIPPRGTRCRLLIRSAFQPPLQVALRSDGSLSWRGSKIEMHALTNRLSASSDDPRPGRLELCRETGVSDQARDRVLAELKTAGFAGPIEVLGPPCGDPGGGGSRD